MKKFEIIDISGDAGLRAFGNSVPELFKNAAKGMYSLITSLKSIEIKESRGVKASGESLEGLLIAFLNELIFYFDTDGFIGREITIERLSENHVEATVSGEAFDTDRHEPGLLIKAATYHNVNVRKTNGSWEASVIFDI
ncbi:MAG TPA: archease [Nitrospirae bacterium]|nr:archease [Nitrospirota bacterium]HDZ87741.1 archease [Nitrospirota bacterium]